MQKINKIEKELARKEKRLSRLEEALKEKQLKQRGPKFVFNKESIKFGIISDTHLGNIYDHHELLEPFYSIFDNEEVDFVLNSGDLLDGIRMYRGQEFEQYAYGWEKQMDVLEQVYPNRKEYPTYFITGNHDYSFFKSVGASVGEEIERRRPDLRYLGSEEADMEINKTKIRLSHPGKGTAYALSYNPQKYIDSLSGGKKPNVLVIGHFHKAEFLPNYRNIYTLQAGCVEGQTSFMKRNNNAAHIGIWVCKIWPGKKGVDKMQATFIPYFEK